ncbi:MAG: hypothetical protein ACYDAR_20670 [Thermomicrobiales bacterium]
MRCRLFFTLALTMLTLSACGSKATPTVAPVPSAGNLPLIAPSSPSDTTTAAASVPAQAIATLSLPVVLATPTPLATAVSVVATRTPMATNAQRPATAHATIPAAGTTPPNGTPQPTQAARKTDVPAVSPQQTLGGAADGLVLLNVRVGKNDGFTRIVFDLAKRDGSAASVPQTRLWREGNTMIVALGGVRDDVYGQSLGGGEQAVNMGVVQAVYRIPIRDDTAAAYGITVHGETRATLSALTSPTRVIVDIADK